MARSVIEEGQSADPRWPLAMVVKRLLAFVLMAAALPLAAQPAGGSGQTSPTRRFVRDFGRDQKAIWTSPFRMSKHTWAGTALPLAAGTAALLAVDKRAVNGLPNTRDQIKWSGRVSTTGAIYTLGGATAVPLILGKLTHRAGPIQVGRSGAEALADAFVVTTALKYALGRERPNDPRSSGRFFHGGRSFPSGHALMAWSVAVAVGRHRRTPRWLAVTSYVSAVAISLSRVGAQRHYPADVLAGSVFGALIGGYVARQSAP